MSRFQILSSFLSLILYLPFIYAQTEDICSVVDTTLRTGPTTAENVVQCFCRDMVTEPIATNPALAAFAALYGDVAAGHILERLVFSFGGHSCTYPANAIQRHLLILLFDF